MTGSFANAKGRLPMPLAGKIVSHFGNYNVEGMSNVRLSNSGINIKGAAGGAVKSVFKGEVSSIFGYGGTMVVMVRHGAYITVYANLRNVSVRQGQKVGTGQTLGTVGSDGVLQFQLRKETAQAQSGVVAPIKDTDNRTHDLEQRLGSSHVFQSLF